MVKFKDFEKDKRIVRAFKVKSKTNPNSQHEVYVSDGEKMKCTCPAGAYNNPCWHKKLIKRFINRDVLTPEELELFEEIEI